MPPRPPAPIVFFSSAAGLRHWLEAQHDSATELWVGVHKVDSGTPSLTYRDIVDQVLCFGWIDGLRKRLDDRRWTIRITPRTSRYSFENTPRTFPPAFEQQFKANTAAWTFFVAQPPGYQRTATWWVTSAVKEDTRQRRLATLIALCVEGRRLEPMKPGGTRPASK